MILFLRNKKENDIAEVEFWIDANGEYRFIENIQNSC
jgi:hypothetical protein